MSGIKDALGLALAYRYIALARAATQHIEGGEELSGLPSFSETTNRYKALVEEWAPEPARTATDACALVEFAAAVTADQTVHRALNESSLVGEERDRMDVVLALAGVTDWLNKAVIAECIAEERAGKGGGIEQPDGSVGVYRREGRQAAG